MKEYYEENKAVAGADLPVEFESNGIKLSIPMEGVTLKGGWKITPQIPPVVRIRTAANHTWLRINYKYNTNVSDILYYFRLSNDL